jgi:GntR family transcriptional regulator, transcriptional repressor for pyruvate dehydrogenase complex
MANNTDKLSSQIANSIMKKIVTGDFKSGEFLPSERHLQDEYQVSRPIIREALQIVAAQGLVSSSSRQGTVVSTDINQPVLQALFLACVRSNVFLEDVLTVRAVLEPHAASLAATNATSAQVRELLSVVNQIEEIEIADFFKGGLQKWRQLDTEFHKLIAQSTQNQVYVILIEVLIEILVSQRRSELESAVTEETLNRAIKEHRAISDAIANGDALSAAESMRLHLESTISNLEQYHNKRMQLPED